MGLVAGLVSLCGIASGQVFSSSPSAPIPPGAPGTTTGTVQDQITISGGPASITSLSVVLNLTHTFTGDLDIVLVPPGGGAYIHLTSDNGAAGDNMTFTRLTQSASTIIGATGTAAPFSADYLPEGGVVAWRAAATIPIPATALANLSGVNGANSNGTWTLIIDDDTGGDVGSLLYWSLEFNGANDPLVPAVAIVATAAAPATIFAGESSTLSATVQPRGTNTVTSVSANASALGLGTIAFSDQGGGVWSGLLSSTGATPSGIFQIPVTVTPSSGTPATANVTLAVRGGTPWNETTDAGQTRDTAVAPDGTGEIAAINGLLDGGTGATEIDVFQIEICNPAGFSADTAPVTTWDTQLFLFDANGLGVVHNDDTTGLRARLTNALVTQPGTYYLAISRYNADPVDSGGVLLWINTPFAGQRAPDGPGAANTWEGWAGTFIGTAGAYTIELTGVCFPTTGPTCNDIDVNNDGSFFDPQDVDAFLSIYSEGDCIPAGAVCDDIDFNNDGSLFDPCDVDSFLRVFSEGPCTSCGE